MAKRIIISSLVTAFLTYSIAVYTVGTATEEPNKMSAAARRGMNVWQQHNCTSCHQFYGLGGYLGPDLTNVISAPGKGEAYARAMITSGVRQMPKFKLTDEELADLIALFEHVDNTGNFPAKNVDMTWFGSFNILKNSRK